MYLGQKIKEWKVNLFVIKVGLKRRLYFFSQIEDCKYRVWEVKVKGLVLDIIYLKQ